MIKIITVLLAIKLLSEPLKNYPKLKHIMSKILLGHSQEEIIS